MKARLRLPLACLAVSGSLMEPAEAQARAEREVATLVVRALDVTVTGQAAADRLRVVARVDFEAGPGPGRLRFRLGARHVVEGVADDQGQRLAFEQAGDAIVVSEEASAGARRSWSFSYAWPLPGPLAEVDGVFSHADWLPGDPSTAAATDLREPSDATIRVELPDPVVALAPGQATVARGAAGRVHEFRARAATHPLVVGRFDWRERRAGELTARVLVPPPLAGRADGLLDLLAESASFFSGRFGAVRADHALVALPLARGQRGVTFPGLVVLAADDVADPQAFSARILAHEVAHQWWSLAVRFPRPEDAWLAEGLPTYSALLFLEEREGAARLREELLNSRATALSTRSPPPLRVGAAMQGHARYTQTYHKAACVLHMLRGLIGREGFLRLARSLYAGNAGLGLTTDEFAAAAGAEAGLDLRGFFRGWLESSELPRLEVSWRAAPDGGGPGQVVSGSVKRVGPAVEAPLRLRVVQRDGARQDAWIRLASASTSFRVPSAGPVVDLLVDPEADLLHDGISVRRR